MEIFNYLIAIYIIKLKINILTRSKESVERG